MAQRHLVPGSEVNPPDRSRHDEPEHGDERCREPPLGACRPQGDDDDRLAEDDDREEGKTLRYMACVHRDRGEQAARERGHAELPGESDAPQDVTGRRVESQ